MHRRRPGSSRVRERLVSTLAVVHQAFQQFLLLPLLLVVVFLLLAVVTYLLDRARSVPVLDQVRGIMQSAVFQSPSATSSLLSTLATSIITVTSITFSFMILAVQGSSAAMTTAVLDQFLRRNVNQIIFGYFIGLAIYVLIILSTVTPPYNPVYGATLGLVLSFVALLLLPVLFYATIYQMRPAIVIASIHDHILHAEEQQRTILDESRRTATLAAPTQTVVRAPRNGFVIKLDLKRLQKVIRRYPDPIEIDLCITIGQYVVHGQALAELRATRAGNLDEVASAVIDAIELGPQRDYTSDSTYGIEQLRTIGWTTASTAKEDPSAALLVVDSLHDILTRWLEPRDPVVDSRAPIVLADHAPEALLEALGSIGLIAIKGLQHRTVAQVVQILATHLPALPVGQRSLVDQIVQTLLKNVPPTFQTPDVANAFAKLAHAYAATGETTLANRIELAITGRGTDAAQSGQPG